MYAGLRKIVPRLLLVAAAAVWTNRSAVAADPMLDQSWDGPTATQPSRGGRDIMREAERGPSLTQRFNLPQFSGRFEVPLPPLLAPKYGGDLAVPPPAPPELARAPYGGKNRQP
jgi:hypothetical protein